MKLVLWDFDDDPSSEKNQTIVIWNKYGSESKADDNILHLPSIVEENSEKLRDLYLNLVDEIRFSQVSNRPLQAHLEIRHGFSYWWMTLIAEKCNFAKSPQITDIIKLLAIFHCIDLSKYSEIVIASRNTQLAQCTKIWCAQQGLKFFFLKHPRNRQLFELSQFRYFTYLPDGLRAIFWLLNYLIKNWKLRGCGVSDWAESKGKVTFVSYSDNLNKEAMLDGLFESFYWTSLSRALTSEQIETNWLHLYVKDHVLPSATKAADAIGKFQSDKSSRQHHVFLSGFLSPTLIGKCLSEWMAIKRMGRKTTKILASNPKFRVFWPLIQNDWKKSFFGQTAVSNILMLNLFECAFKRLPRQNVGVFLQENQGWEAALVHSWKANKHYRLIGFPHSTVRFWDLRYFNSKKTYFETSDFSKPMPDIVACSGGAAFDEMLRAGAPRNTLVRVEALRYLHLNYEKKIYENQNKSKILHLLLVGDYVKENSLLQLSYLRYALSKASVSLNVTIKPHPNCPLDAEIRAGEELKISEKPIASLLKACDLVFSSAGTSAAVDAWLSGVPLISLLNGHELNLSPLRGRSGVVFVATPVEFSNALSHFDLSQACGKSDSEYFDLNTELVAWKAMLKTASSHS